MSEFLYGLNTSTIRPAGLMEKIRIAAAAGYAAIELWIADVEEFLAGGGSVADVAKALDDHALLRPSMISLKDWCSGDQRLASSALEAARRRLDAARALGVQRIVAGPPRDAVPVPLAVECYGRLLELSVERGVPASLEFLGFVQSISTLEMAWQIAEATGNPARTITPDPWHIFRGGSDPGALGRLPADAISIVHWNDAPQHPAREQQTDAHRVMPGDGILDLRGMADCLRNKGWRGVLSLELFNEEYWEQDPLHVARLGLEKMKRSVESDASI